MTLGKFLQVVQSGHLWFTSIELIKRLERHEGRLGAADGLVQKYLAAYGADVASMMYISCWTEGPAESQAMWSLYTSGGEGVCIRTTAARFADAVADEPVDVHLARINYVDYAKTDKPIQDGNALSRFMYKREVLSAEREVRAWLLRPESSTPATAVATRLATLVEHVIVYPGASKWFRVAVESLVQSCQLMVPVVHSSIDEDPPALPSTEETYAYMRAQREAHLARARQLREQPAEPPAANRVEPNSEGAPVAPG